MIQLNADERVITANGPVKLAEQTLTEGIKLYAVIVGTDRYDCITREEASDLYHTLAGC